ncbi:PQQ-binding-like beta-propeller repeat protein [Streptomyces sp. NPDC085614]|uniref:protein kinase domain-containing protein n=1 Tax=Streptomyces sp. NPDC085614 TaxID=3365733 RepID=UPI0037D8830A
MQSLATGDPLRLGPYRLLGVLGEGGMGKVYFGRDGSGRPAAVKVLRPDLAHDRHLAQRFVREAEMARAVTGKGVARVLGAQTEGGRPWIAAEFLAGPTLDEAVRSYGPMDEPTVRALAHFLSRTLHDIHAAGLVHRDLKPANIVLTSSGPRVIDFGIARPEHGLTLTTTGQIPVTPGYGAPEQVLGRRVGPASDVFSLGAVLVFAASGRRAFDATHVAAVQYEVVHGTPDLDGVPPALRDLIGPCLAKDPALRPAPTQIAAAFAPPKGAGRAWRKGPLAEDIARREATTKGLTATAHTVVPGTPTRRRFLGLAAAGAGVVAAGGGGTAWWLTREERSPTHDVPQAVPTPAAPFLSVIDVKPGEAPAPLWGPLDVTAANGQVPLPVRDVVIVQAKSGGLLALSVTDGKERWRAKDIDADAGFVSVADRLVVAVDDERTAHAFVAATGRHVWSTDADADHLLAADATHVYLITGDNELRAVDAWNPAVTWSRPMPSPRSPIPARAAAGGGRLVVHDRTGQVTCVDTATGTTRWSLKNQGTNGPVPVIADDTVYLGGSSLTARKLDKGDVVWTESADERSRKAGVGWGSPTVDEDRVYALDSYNAYRYGTLVNSDSPTMDWYEVLEGVGSTVTAPAVEGTTAWLPGPDKDYVRVVDKKTDDWLFTLTMKREGPYAMASDGNRVFVDRGGRVLAMPVFGKA